MKIILFGGDGQLGREIQQRAEAFGAEIAAPPESDLDICSQEGIDNFIGNSGADCIINAAAFTAVDKAEHEQEKAYLVNRDGPRIIAEAAERSGVRLLHLSTDYVFDGMGSTPLGEEAPVNPLNVYGQSKLAGEQEILRAHGEGSLIVRTSSLHGQYGVNFVHTMLSFFREKESLKVVNDQFMSPTWAGWLAEVLLVLSAKPDEKGVIHASCAGSLSWYEYACAIKALVSGQLEGPLDTVIEPVPSSEFPRPALRPRYSVFDCSRLTSVLGRPPIPWLNGLKNHLVDIGYQVQE